jgi:hypothetical protein
VTFANQAALNELSHSRNRIKLGERSFLCKKYSLES